MTIDLEAITARADKAHAELVALCNGKRWQMRIPADEGSDSDLVIGAALADNDALVAEVKRLTAIVEAVEKLADAIVMPIGTMRHGVNCTMRKAMYDGARCVCDLTGLIERSVRAELAAALSSVPGLPDTSGDLG